MAANMVDHLKIPYYHSPWLSELWNKEILDHYTLNSLQMLGENILILVNLESQCSAQIWAKIPTDNISVDNSVQTCLERRKHWKINPAHQKLPRIGGWYQITKMMGSKGLRVKMEDSSTFANYWLSSELNTRLMFTKCPRYRSAQALLFEQLSQKYCYKGKMEGNWILSVWTAQTGQKLLLLYRMDHTKLL